MQERLPVCLGCLIEAEKDHYIALRIMLHRWTLVTVILGLGETDQLVHFAQDTSVRFDATLNELYTFAYALKISILSIFVRNKTISAAFNLTFGIF